MERNDSADRLRELQEKYDGYTDKYGYRIGKFDGLFVDEADQPEYIGAKMGLFDLSGTTLIPMGTVRLNDQERTVEVSEIPGLRPILGSPGPPSLLQGDPGAGLAA